MPGASFQQMHVGLRPKGCISSRPEIRLQASTSPAPGSRLLETDQLLTSLQLEYELPELTLPEREALTDLLVALLDGHVI
jgi:hypothetical protein